MNKVHHNNNIIHNFTAVQCHTDYTLQLVIDIHIVLQAVIDMPTRMLFLALMCTCRQQCDIVIISEQSLMRTKLYI